jgi:hypothetical protein
MKFEEVLGDLRKGSQARLSDIAGIFIYENGKLFQINEKIKKEFTQLESYLESDGWNLIDDLKDSNTVQIKILRAAWDSLIVPDTNFGTNSVSDKFLSFVKALGY